MVAKDSDMLMKKRYEEAFGLIKYISNVDELQEDQIRLIKAFATGKTYILTLQRVMEVQHVK